MSRVGPVLIVLLLCSSLVGCFSDEEVEQEEGYVWQEKEEINCQTPTNEDLICSEYLTGFVTPVSSLLHPTLEELWIVDLSGNISAWNGESIRNVADLTDIVSTCHYEQGLLGLEFDENFAETGNVLLSYVENGSCEGPNKSRLILAEASVEDGQIHNSSLNTLRAIEQPYRNHNGGHLLGIGNNQYLWGLGDGGGSKDPHQNGQNKSNPHGAIHLFHYFNNTISPVVNGSDSDPYILHSGLRNPWKFDVDPNGGLWIADVGQSCWEEINLVPVLEPTNLGWSEMEGFYEFDPDSNCEENTGSGNEAYTDPVAVYSHDSGAHCSISGGHWMDWGPEVLQDGYLYGDFCSGAIWVIKENENGSWIPELIDNSGTMIVGFGRGLNDELLIFSWAGAIYQLTEI